MAAVHFATKHNTLLYMARKAGLSQVDLCKILGYKHTNTMKAYFINPTALTLSQLMILSSAFNVSVYTLFYQLMRNQCMLTKEDKIIISALEESHGFSFKV